jgi:glutaminase
MNYSEILKSIYEEVKVLHLEGKVASYIPQLAKVNADKFGICLMTVDGKEYKVGDTDENFSIQSISKVFTLTHVMSLVGETIWERIGVEPSGNSFNSIVQLEYENGIPRNPFINAGALVMADVLVSKLNEPKKDFLEFVRKVSGNNNIEYNLAVAQSEKETGFMNASLVNMLKSRGNIHNKVEDVLDFYFHQCSIEMTCKDLANSFMLFANQGKCAHLQNPIITGSQVKRISALMLSCGFYDESGEFAYKVGLPGKSGVGGGIVAVQPQKYSVAVWNPKLNKKGNSSLGMKALELLTTKTGMSIF